MILRNRKLYSVNLMCLALRVSSSGFYKWQGIRNKPVPNLDLAILVQFVFYLNRKRYGCKRIAQAICKFHEMQPSKGKVYRVMKHLGLQSIHRKKYKVSTTDSNHNLKISPNLLKRQFKVEKPNSVWVSDITYIPTAEEWQYLAVIIDLFNREVVGWNLSSRIDADLVVNAFGKAVSKQNIPQMKQNKGLIFHSDRGSQYASGDFRNAIKPFGIRQSMSRKGDCWDNAVAESFFKSLKVEEVYQNKYEIKEQALRSIFDYIENYYNKIRIHSTLKGMTPQEFKLAATA